MTIKSICPVSGQSVDEERINYLTHLAGLFLSVIGFVILLVYSLHSNNFTDVLSSIIYGITLVSLYAASTFYHGCEHPSKKHKFKIMDHVCIYLLIAGTYTPFTLGPLKDTGGYNLLYLVWGIALVGVAFKIFAISRFQLLSVFAYLGMGWLVVYNFPALSQELSTVGFVCLIAGGLSYSLGVLFYLWEGLSYNHGIWHLFVLGGSSFHYVSILNILQTKIALSSG